MKPILKKASRNYLYQHPWQLILAILGITLGVAVVVSIDLALDSSLNSFTRTTQALSGKATHRITASDGGLDENLYRSLRVEHGIQHLSPTVSGYVTTEKPNNNTLKLYGIDPLIESSFQSSWQQNNVAGDGLRLITEPNSVLISYQTAIKLGLKLGETLTVRSDIGRHDLTVIGWISEDNAISKELLDNLLITDIATAQECLGLLGKLDSIDVILDQGQIPSNQISKLQAIRKTLPLNVLLTPLENQAESLKQMTHAFAINLKALGLLSLLVGVFLIYNTMTFLVIQRRGLFGILRSIGVTRKQIFHLIIGEAIILAIIGTVLGCVSGILLGQGLLQLISGTIDSFFFRVDSSSLILSPLLIGKGIILGLGVTLLAVLAPAWEATRQSPHRTLIRSQLESSSRRFMQIAAIVALLFLLGSLVLILLPGKNVSLGLTSIFLMLFGFALLIPWVTIGLMKLFEKLLSASPSVLARFPFRLVRAEISRTGIALATLMIAVAASIGMDLMIGSFRLTVSEWLQTSLQADLYVSLSGKTQLTNKSRTDQQMKAGLARLKGVDMLSNVLHTRLIHDQTSTAVAVFELNEKSKRGFIFKQQTDNVWESFIHQNSLFVTEPYAYHNNTHIGDIIKLKTTKGEEAFKVIGIYADYSGDQGHLAMSRDVYQQYWPDLGYTGIGIYLKEGADIKQLEAQVKPLLKPYQTIKSEQAIYRASMQMFEQTFKITEVLRWLAASIAFVGVFSALMALQFERTRQLGILRAIGMTPWQVARLISIETGLMGLIAGLFAVPVGLAMAYVLIFVVYQRSFGWTLAFHFDAGIIVQGVLLACFAALLAGVLPALKMAKTNPAQALRSE